ncbi:hypothetical protein AX17_001274 [Amanita inopinata Kibby_2008]|nr:hypothetical protein AX17_001274 [Amanita inopinata Kibby_2008]
MGYQVTNPSGAKGWTNSGQQPLSWQRVDTDPLNFTVVLTNTDRTVFPINDQVLSALVDGTLLKTSMNPPSGGWPTGDHFRVNFVQDTNNLDSILAQSDEFTIKVAQSSSLSLPPMASNSVATLVSTPVTMPVVTTSVNGNPESATMTQDTISPSGSNGALASSDLHAGMLGAFALLGIFLA